MLDGLVLKLRNTAEVATATSGAEGISLLEASPEFAVVVSDMRMPQMNGVMFLKVVRARWPNTVRMLLTGYADLDTAMSAVNENNIFRFLAKPCASHIFSGAIEAAARQHRLLISGRELLERTLKGAAEVMCEVLEITSPAAFGAGRRIQSIALSLAKELGVRDELWTLELAPLLGQLGAVTLPPEAALKVHTGARLTAEEQAMVDKLPEVADRLLAHVPRLEPVRGLLKESRQAASTRVLAGILRTATNYHRASSSGLAFEEAFASLDGDSTYDRQTLDALAKVEGLARKASRVVELRLHELRPGMRLARDVLNASGGLLLGKGHQMSEHVLTRLANSARSVAIREPIGVWVDEATGEVGD